MEYHDSPTAKDFASRTAKFMEEIVIPAERTIASGEKISTSTLEDLRDQARRRDIYAPQISREYGGLGLTFRDVLPSFEIAGRSLLGPPALRIDAPDQGNMDTLERVGTTDQKDRWLGRLVEGEISSGFSMTEPMQGAGSDPKMIETTARREGEQWSIEGHKWLTTNGVDADLLFVMARTDLDAHPYSGCSIIAVPSTTDGVEVVREIPHLGGQVIGTNHAEIKYHEVRVPYENLIGPENDGFSVAQRRLGPARLTHCMRYSGMGTRALDVAKAYTTERTAFGEALADKQAVRHKVASAEINIHAARCMIRHAANEIESGSEARIPVAMSKVFTANVVQESIDIALQLCGGNGIARDLPIADFFEEVRQFRIVDGADEVHLRSIARESYADVDPSELKNLTRYMD